MADSWSSVLLLITNIVCISTTVSSQFCLDSGWSYHSHTKTCIKVFSSNVNFNGASKECRAYKGGYGKTKNGHLVFILDADTNNYVKGLIGDAGVLRAIIGLHDRTIANYYVWGDVAPFRDYNYTDWSEGEPRVDTYYTTVVITQDGWKKYYTRSTASSVCQVDAVFPSPTVTCLGPAEVGESSSLVTCSLSANYLGNFKNLIIASSTRNVAECKEGSTSCHAYPGYQATFHDRDYTAMLAVDKVGREHEGRYTCSYQFEGVPDTMSDSCNMEVYVVPEKPKCSYTLTDTGLDIVCVTDQVYPQGDCVMEYYKNGNLQTTKDPIRSSVSTTVGGFEYYITTCRISVDIYGSGAHAFKMIMFPEGYSATSNAVAVTDVEINIAPPTEPPILSGSGGSPLPSIYDVTENNTISVTCSVQGGSPSVTSTTLMCSEDVKDQLGRSTETEHGQSVTMIFSASREMDGGHCTCSANHLSKAYTDTTHIGFSVKYPASAEYFRSSPYEPRSGEGVTLRCMFYGNPTPTITIISVDETRKEEILKEDITSRLSYTMTVFCKDSGKYFCRGRNDLNIADDVQSLDLFVRCPPVHCDDQEDRPKFGAAINKDVVIKLCVFGYPKPTNFQLSSGGSLVQRDKYSASFEYTNAASAKGEITLEIKEIQRGDLGKFDLYTGYDAQGNGNTNTYVYFELVPRGPPSCATEVKMIKSYSDKVTLSWKPGFNGGLKQRFIIKHLEGEKIAEVEDSEELVMLYNITGLKESSSYIFSVVVSNDEGLTECPDLVINVTTTALPISQDDTPIASIIIPVIIVIIIVVVIIIGVIFFMKRRRNKKENIEMSAEFKARGRGDGASLVRGANTENVYANADDNGAGKGNKDKNKGQKKKKEEKKKEKAEKEKMEKEKYTEEATYAVVNKEDKKKKNANMKKPTRKNTEKGGQSVEAIYTPVVKKGGKNNDSARGGEEEVVIENDLYGKSSDLGNEEVVIENDLYGKSSDLDNAEVVIENDLYGKSSDLTTYSNMAVAGNGHGDYPDESVYANETATAPPGTKKGGKKKEEKNKGRTVTPDGLVYVTVEINQKTKNPEIVSDGAESRRPLKPPKPCPQADRVDYVSIDYTAKADGQEKEYANS